MAVVTVGVHRIRVEEWLDAGPFPSAMVVALDEASPIQNLTERVDTAMRAWRRVAALASELGADVGTIDLNLPDDPINALWTLCSVAPLEQIDRQRLLETDQPENRADLLLQGLNEKGELLRARLGSGFA